MHTLRLTVIGLVLLSVFVFVAAQINQHKGKAVDGARIFIWVWLGGGGVQFRHQGGCCRLFRRD